MVMVAAAAVVVLVIIVVRWSGHSSTRGVRQEGVGDRRRMEEERGK